MDYEYRLCGEESSDQHSANPLLEAIPAEEGGEWQEGQAEQSGHDPPPHRLVAQYGDADGYDELPEGWMKVELVDTLQVLVGHCREVPLIPQSTGWEAEMVQPGPHPKRDRADADEEHREVGPRPIMTQKGLHGMHVTRFRERL